MLFPESVFYNNLVAPFWANYDLRQYGTISYEVHTTMTGLMSIVTNYIQSEEDDEFIGTWMTVATFTELPLQDSTMNDVC